MTRLHSADAGAECKQSIRRGTEGFDLHQGQVNRHR
jgi:hypothetical protein